MANVWDALKNTVDKTVDSYTKMKNAENEFKSSMLLAKIKSQWETDAKKEEKQTLNPYEQMMMDEYKAQKEGGMGGIGQDTRPTEFVPGAKGITQKKVGLRDMAERVYMKPEEQWTPNDRSIVERYKKFSTNNRVSKPTREYDPDLTQGVLDKLLDENKSDEDFKLDLEDLKKNSALYEKAGVDVGSLFNSALKHPRATPQKKGFIQKFMSLWK